MVVFNCEFIMNDYFFARILIVIYKNLGQDYSLDKKGISSVFHIIELFFLRFVEIISLFGLPMNWLCGNVPNSNKTIRKL